MEVDEKICSGKRGAEQLKGKTKVNTMILYLHVCPEGGVDKQLFGNIPSQVVT